MSRLSAGDAPDLASLPGIGVAVGSIGFVAFAELDVRDVVDFASRAELERSAEDWPLLTTLPTLVPPAAVAS